MKEHFLEPKLYMFPWKLSCPDNYQHPTSSADLFPKFWMFHEHLKLYLSEMESITLFTLNFNFICIILLIEWPHQEAISSNENH